MKRGAYGIVVLFLFALGCQAPKQAAPMQAAPEQISDSGRGAFEASLVSYANGLAVAWHDNRDGNAEIYLRFVDLEGQQLLKEHRLTETDAHSYEADIATIGDNFAVAWYEKSHGTYTAKLGMWEPSGKPQWTTVIGPNTRIPVVAAHRDRIFCAWLVAEPEGTTLWAGWWDLEGHVVGSPQRLGPASPTTWHLSATIDDNGVGWVVYDALIETRVKEIWMVSVDGDTVDLRRLTSDDGKASTYPDLALSDHGAALTWFDERDGNREVYLFVGERSALEARLEVEAKRITSTPGESIGATIAWNGNRLGLTWCDNSGDQHEVYFRDFDANGTALEELHQITRNDTSSLIPALVPWRAGFAVVWNEVVVDPNHHPHSPATLSEIHFVVVP